MRPHRLTAVERLIEPSACTALPCALRGVVTVAPKGAELFLNETRGVLGSTILTAEHLMKPHFTYRLRGSVALTAASLLLGINGCSFLYNLSTTQCNSTADCHALGKDFCRFGV